MNTMERSIAAAGESPTLYPQHLPIYIRVEIARSSLEILEGKKQRASAGSARPFKIPPSLQTARDESDRQYLSEVLDYTGGNIKKTCKISGLSRSRLYVLLKNYNLVKRS